MIALDSFDCGGLIVARSAERSGVPVHAARSTWTQELKLARGGNTELLVFHGSRAAQYSGKRGRSAAGAGNPGGSLLRFVYLDVEDNDTFEQPSLSPRAQRSATGHPKSRSTTSQTW